MLMRLLSAGLLAGVLAGVCVAALQEVTTTPLILKAETYEGQQPTTGHNQSSLKSYGGAPIILAHSDHADVAGPGEQSAVWAPTDGLQRTLATSVTTIGAAVGFGLMLLALMLASNATITAPTAALWGAAGFVVTGLAPGLGLAPKLPGSAAGDLFSSQIWWIATAAATAAGLWIVWRARSLGAVVGAISLMAIPHVIGAPTANAYTSTVPAELAAHFTSTSLAVHAVLWILVGALAGFFWDRQTQRGIA